MKKKERQNFNKITGAIFTIITICVIAYFNRENIFAQIQEITNETNQTKQNITASKTANYTALSEIPEYNNEISVTINNNIPFFTEEEHTTQSFEKYSELDALGRCGVAYANICKETMPPEGDERGNISSVRPTGWKQAKFQGEYIYNRCHLIAYSLSDEDANKQNLITGTRYFNVEGMLPYEMKVLDYLKANKDNHVLYRVTPDFKGNNLLANGVEIEAYSVEDNGEGICFNVYVYNVQPGANIDYETGKLQ